MGIGIGVFLITLGAILKFAITVDLAGVNLHMIGLIFMIVGAGITILTLITLPRRRGNQSQETYEEGPPSI